MTASVKLAEPTRTVGLVPPAGVPPAAPPVGLPACWPQAASRAPAAEPAITLVYALRVNRMVLILLQDSRAGRSRAGVQWRVAYRPNDPPEDGRGQAALSTSPQ